MGVWSENGLEKAAKSKSKSGTIGSGSGSEFNAARALGAGGALAHFAACWAARKCWIGEYHVMTMEAKQWTRQAERHAKKQKQK